MEELVWIGLMILAFGIFIILLQFALISIPAWGLGVAGGWLALLILRDEYLDTKDSNSVINRSVSFSFDGDKISHSLVDFDYKKCPEAKYHLKLSLLICSIITLGILLFLYGATNYFKEFKFWGNSGSMPAQFNFILSCLPSAGLVYYWFSQVEKNFNSRINNMIVKRISALNLSIDASGEISGIKSDIRILSGEIRIPVAEEYTIAINDFIQSNSAAMLSNSMQDKIRKRHEAELKNAKAYRDNLRTVIKLSKDANDAYLGAQDPVYKTGNNMFYEQLQKGFEALNSGTLTDKIMENNWTEYRKMISLIIEFFDDLKTKAEKYQPGDEQEEEREENQNNAGKKKNSDDMTKQEAYELLGVFNTATNEEVKKAYKDKMKEYHPNLFMNQPEWVKKQSHEMTQKIVQAHDIIMGKREK
jgi:hypothetical protein